MSYVSLGLHQRSACQSRALFAFANALYCGSFIALPALCALLLLPLLWLALFFVLALLVLMQLALVLLVCASSLRLCLVLACCGIAVGVAALLCFARCRALGAARCNAAGHLRDALLVLPLLGGARQGWG